MVITTPTRITIEVTPLQPGEAGTGGGSAVSGAVTGTANGPLAQLVVASVDPTLEAQRPPDYEPAPCHCLDDEDCTADHEHE